MPLLDIKGFTATQNQHRLTKYIGIFENFPLYFLPFHPILMLQFQFEKVSQVTQIHIL